MKVKYEGTRVEVLRGSYGVEFTFIPSVINEVPQAIWDNLMEYSEPFKDLVDNGTFQPLSEDAPRKRLAKTLTPSPEEVEADEPTQEEIGESLQDMNVANATSVVNTLGVEALEDAQREEEASDAPRKGVLSAIAKRFRALAE